MTAKNTELMQRLGLRHRFTGVEAVMLATLLCMLIAGMLYAPALQVLIAVVWLSGPLSVLLYILGVVLGRLTADGLRYAFLGGVFSLVWAVGTLLGFVDSIHALLYYFLAGSFDMLALAVGTLAIDRSRHKEDNDVDRFTLEMRRRSR